MSKPSAYRVVVDTLNNSAPLLMPVNGNLSYVVLVNSEGYKYWNKLTEHNTALPKVSVSIEPEDVLKLSETAPVWFVHGGKIEKQLELMP